MPRRLPFRFLVFLFVASGPAWGLPVDHMLTACQDISQSGVYHLDRDLSGSAGSACVRIHDVSDVELDCHGHSIATDSRSLAAVVVETVRNFTIQACELPQLSGFSLFVGNSRDGKILRNRLKDAVIGVPDGQAAISVIGNRFSEFGAEEFGTRDLGASENEVIPLEPGFNRLEAQALSVPIVDAPPGPPGGVANLPSVAPLHIHPNPWRGDRDAGTPVHFENVPAGAELAIFTVSGRWVKSLDTSLGKAGWNLQNDAGENVASGHYFYVVKNSAGARQVGELAVIR